MSDFPNFSENIFFSLNFPGFFYILRMYFNTVIFFFFTVFQVIKQFFILGRLSRFANTKKHGQQLPVVIGKVATDAVKPVGFAKGEVKPPGNEYSLATLNPPAPPPPPPSTTPPPPPPPTTK